MAWGSAFWALLSKRRVPVEMLAVSTLVEKMATPSSVITQPEGPRVTQYVCDPVVGPGDRAPCLAPVGSFWMVAKSTLPAAERSYPEESRLPSPNWMATKKAPS